jgi:hypothetical protein
MIDLYSGYQSIKNQTSCLSALVFPHAKTKLLGNHAL